MFNYYSSPVAAILASTSSGKALASTSISLAVASTGAAAGAAVPK
jgi:hypothetical protein